MLGKLNPDFWRLKKVLVTGHTGFKGSWLCQWLLELGAEVTGYSLAPNTVPALFNSLQLDECIEHYEGDIRNKLQFYDVISCSKPDIIIHLAAQPIVSVGYDDPSGTFETNIMGVVNILDYFKHSKQNIPILIISSDKCYLNNDSGKPFTVFDPLGGHDPYSASKAGTEIVVSAYTSSYFKRDKGPVIASARAGNVIGGGDWSLNRLIPDAASAFNKGDVLTLRNPQATRPWQHVLEPLYGYLVLIEAMSEDKRFGSAWNFGPEANNTQSVGSVCQQFSRYWGQQSKVKIAKKKQDWKEAKFLELDVTKTTQDLHWQSVLDMNNTLKWCAKWYKSYYNQPTTENVRKNCISQIVEYTELQEIYHKHG